MQWRSPQEQCPAQKEFVCHQFFFCSVPEVTALCDKVANTSTGERYLGFSW